MQAHPSTPEPDNRYPVAVARLFVHVEEACAAQAEWPLGVRAAIEAALEFLAAEPAAARLLLFDYRRLGGEAQLRHEATLTALAGLVRAGRAEADKHPRPDLFAEGMIGGLFLIVARPLERGEPERLVALGPELTSLLLSPYLGWEEAERVAGLSDEPLRELPD